MSGGCNSMSEEEEKEDSGGEAMEQDEEGKEPVGNLGAQASAA